MTPNVIDKTLQTLSDQELWQLFPIVLRPYQASWALDFETEKTWLLDHLGQSTVERITHIGSTSVPGLIAKPTIDILVEISEKTDLELFKQKMEQAGYIFSPQPHKPLPHMMFLKGYTVKGFAEKVFHAHIRYPGNWDEPYFCEYLRQYPAIAAEYGKLKQDLQKRYQHDRDAYTQAKTEFVAKYTQLAKKEFKNNTEIKNGTRI